MNIVLENVSMKAALGHLGKPMHEAKDLGPPDMQPRDLCQLGKNHSGRDTPPKLAKLAEKCQLKGAHLAQLWQRSARAQCTPNLTAI